MQAQREQHIPLKVYRSDNRITVAAPMPGLEPEDITVEVTGAGLLTLHGELRGVQKGVNEQLVNEWDVGGYYREYQLPEGVDAPLANLTFANGLLVAAFPLSATLRPARLTLHDVSRTEGQRVAHTGSNIEPV
jgi:HSP20 family protein